MEFFKLFVFLLILAVGGVLSSPTEVPAEVKAPQQGSAGTADLDTSETVLNGYSTFTPGLGLGLGSFGGLGLSVRTPMMSMMPGSFIPNFPFTYALQPGLGYVNLRQPVDPSVLLFG